jgi:integrase
MSKPGVKHETLLVRDAKGVPRWRVQKPVLREDRGGAWYVACRELETGRVKRKTFEGVRSKARAVQAASDWCQEQIRKAEGKGPVPLTTRFADAYRQWTEVKTLKPSTARDLDSCLRVYTPTFGKRFLDEIKPIDIEKFLKGLEREREVAGEREEEGKVIRWRRTVPPATARTRRKHLSNLRSLFTWALRHQLCRRDPTAGIKVARGPKRQGVALTHEEAGRLLKASREDKVLQVGTGWDQTFHPPPYLYSAVLIALHTGLRAGNVRGLTWGQCDLSKRKITISGSEMKAHEDVSLPIHPELAEHLQGLLRGRRRTPAADALVLGVEVEAMSKGFKSALGRAELPRTIRFHDLRHSFCSWAATRCPLAVLRALMGHVSPGGSMTLHYTHVPFDEMRAVVDAMPRLLPAGAPAGTMMAKEG